jgi:hypothetical protein
MVVRLASRPARAARTATVLPAPTSPVMTPRAFSVRHQPIRATASPWCRPVPGSTPRQTFATRSNGFAHATRRSPPVQCLLSVNKPPTRPFSVASRLPPNGSVTSSATTAS